MIPHKQEISRIAELDLFVSQEGPYSDCFMEERVTIYFQKTLLTVTQNQREFNCRYNLQIHIVDWLVERTENMLAYGE
jgi:hypothetical protein